MSGHRGRRRPRGRRSDDGPHDGERIDGSHTRVTYDGPPHVDPLKGRAGCLGDLCRDLTVAEVAELCRYLDWRRLTAGNPRASWHYSTRLSYGQRLLVGHGLRADSWRT